MIPLAVGDGSGWSAMELADAALHFWKDGGWQATVALIVLVGVYRWAPWRRPKGDA